MLEGLNHISPILTLIAVVCSGAIVVMRVNDGMKDIKASLAGHEKRIRNTEKRMVRVETTLHIDSPHAI